MKEFNHAVTTNRLFCPNIAEICTFWEREEEGNARDLKGERESNHYRFLQIPLRFSFLLRCSAFLFSLAL